MYVCSLLAGACAEPSTNYYVGVTACSLNVKGQEHCSGPSQRSVTTLAVAAENDSEKTGEGTGALAPPVGLQAHVLSATDIELSWRDSLLSDRLFVVSYFAVYGAPQAGVPLESIASHT